MPRMRPHYWAAAVVTLALTTPTPAGEVYGNGPPMGGSGLTLSGETISDSFTLWSAMPISSAQAALWVHKGDKPTFVDWSFGTSVFGTDLGSGTAAVESNVFLFTNNLGFDIYESKFEVSASPSAAGTYWFTLSNPLSQDESGVDWDQNGGQSQAFEMGSPGETESESFQLFNNFASGPVVPEPTGLMLVGMCLTGLAARAWRRFGRNVKNDDPCTVWDTAGTIEVARRRRGTLAGVDTDARPKTAHISINLIALQSG
jgi:hypothetical protein